ncbi:hypothetical protein ACQKH5_02710 [Hyphomonas sp. NPDC076900]|uniref:hypothetical protein n=1 Tax=unclassified Hyphomonas TaxID=2630699 RepID=UPI003D00CC95
MLKIEIYDTEVSPWTSSTEGATRILSCTVTLQTSVGQRVQSYSVVRSERAGGAAAFAVILNTNFKILSQQSVDDCYLVALAKHKGKTLFSIPCLHQSVSFGSQIVIEDPDYVSKCFAVLLSGLDIGIEFHGPDGLLDTAAFFAQEGGVDLLTEFISKVPDSTSNIIRSIVSSDVQSEKSDFGKQLHCSYTGWRRKGHIVEQEWKYKSKEVNSTIKISAVYENRGSIFNIAIGKHRFFYISFSPGWDFNGIGGVCISDELSSFTSGWLSAQIVRDAEGNSVVGLMYRQDGNSFGNALNVGDSLEISVRFGNDTVLNLPLPNTSEFHRMHNELLGKNL